MTSNPSVDGVVPASQPQEVPPATAPVASADVSETPAEKASVKRWKASMVIVTVFLYIAYVMWCGILLAILPSEQDLSSLVMAGVASCLAGALVFLGIALFMFFHIAQSKAAPRSKYIALIKLALIAIPGIALSIFTAFMIMREPMLSIDITSPLTSDEMVAPLAMTFDTSSAVEILKRNGFSPIEYSWDINGDKQIDQKTLEPNITATYDREGIYTVSVSMRASDNTTRVASRRFIINKSVFSVTPSPAIVDAPVVFSLAHLFTDPAAIKNVAWDFEGDGQVDEESTMPQITHTYLITGKVRASALVSLVNNTQVKFERVIDVQNPPPLPFPAKVTSDPQVLIGTAPFTARFEVETDEPIVGTQWVFGDGQRGDGNVTTHTFQQNGSYAVMARVRSQSGEIAEIPTLVKVVDRLTLNDLRFEGSHAVVSNKISGEAPMSITLKGVTNTPFVSFSWEAPKADEVGSTQTTLQAIYRTPGIYTVTMIAQDSQNHVLRQPITVEVRPPSSLVSIRMQPESGEAPLKIRFDASDSSIPGEDITGYSWDYGDNTPVVFGGAITEHTYQNPGKYVVSVTATSTSGLTQSTSRTISVRAPQLQAQILPSRFSGAAPLRVIFEATPSTGPITTYLWDFGDGAQDDKLEADHVFTDPGTYKVTLTVSDATGKSSSTYVTITVTNP
jgi:PKD repeat protein